MAKYTGTLRYSDLEGGFYELVADDGNVYRLEGAFDCETGARVRVHGKVDAAGFGIHMTGPAISVDRIETIGSKTP
jgi:hypothetical protein